MKGRGTIQIPLEHIVEVGEDLKRDVLEIVVEGNSYPGWHHGMEPMVFIGAHNLDDEEFIRALIHYTSTGAWPGAEKLEPVRKALRELFDKSDVNDGNHMEYEAAEEALALFKQDAK